MDVNHNTANNQRRVLLPKDFGDYPIYTCCGNPDVGKEGGTLVCVNCGETGVGTAHLNKVMVAELSHHYGKLSPTYDAGELISAAYRLLRKADARLNEQIAERNVPAIDGDKDPEEYSDTLFQTQETLAELSAALRPPVQDSENVRNEEPRKEV